MKEIKNKTPLMLKVENKYNVKLEELLRIMHVEQNMHTLEMCKELQISNVTLLDWLKKAGIYSRRLTSLLD